MGEKQQVQINRMIEALEMIADMPSVDPALGLTAGQVAAQYEEARETARLAVAQFERSEADEARESSARGGAEGAEGGDAPLKRVALAVAVMFDLIDAMPDADAVDAIEVIKERALASIDARSARKGVAHG